MINKTFIAILVIMLSLSIVSCRKVDRTTKITVSKENATPAQPPRKPIFAEYKYDGRQCDVPQEKQAAFHEETFREVKDLNDKFLSRVSSDTSGTLYVSMYNSLNNAIMDKYCVMTDVYIRGDRHIYYLNAVPEEQRIFDEMKKDYFGLNDTANTSAQ